MRITGEAADCADADNLGAEAKNPPTMAQTSSAYLKLHPEAMRTRREGPNAGEFATMKRVIVRFRKTACWNERHQVDARR
jgi:hypothetical protein